MKEVIIPENLLGLDPHTCESYHQGDLNRMVKKQIKCIEPIWTVYSVYFSPSAGKSPQVWISGIARQASPTKVFNRHEKQWGWPSVAEDCDLKTSNNGDPCGVVQNQSLPPGLEDEKSKKRRQQWCSWSHVDHVDGKSMMATLVVCGYFKMTKWLSAM